MARLHVVAVANRLPAWAQSARDEYLKRMPRGYEVRLVELKPSAAGKIRKEIPKNTRLVALDERGSDFTTKQFATLLGEQRGELLRGEVPAALVQRDEACVRRNFLADFPRG